MGPMASPRTECAGPLRAGSLRAGSLRAGPLRSVGRLVSARILLSGVNASPRCVASVCRSAAASGQRRVWPVRTWSPEWTHPQAARIVYGVCHEST